MTRAVPWVLLSGVAALSLAACGYFGDEAEPYRPPAYYQPPEPAATPAAVDLGRRLYLRDCAFCHGSEGQGTAQGPSVVTGTNGPALTDFMLRTGRMPIDSPTEETRHRDPLYTEEEIAAIVTYMDTEFPGPGPDIPKVDPAHGDLGEGQELWQEHCVACHATTGIGGAMLMQEGGETRGIVIPPIGQSTPVEIAESVRTGPGTMPVFGPHLISDEEMNALVRYTLYLHAPRDEGGAPFGRVGPVIEGALGWAIGLGVLLLVIRWVGTKAGERP